MEIFLLAITVVSLVIAFVMSAAAWRLSREERTRSSARVAALAAAAAGDVDAPARPPAVPHVVTSNESVDLSMVTPAAEPAALAQVRPAPWSTARVSTFAVPSKTAVATAPVAAATTRTEVHPSIAPAPAMAQETPRPVAWRPASEAAAAFVETTAVLETRGAARPDPAPAFFGSSVAAPSSGGPQRGLAIAAMILFVVVAGGGYWMVFGKPEATTAAAATVESAPLELISLRHERRGGRLAVTGLVRNPVAGKAVEKLNAVVFLFDQQGNFVSSARADVDFRQLGPGDESPFVVNIDAPSAVARYRVSFRNETGVVPHIDRRGQEPIATTPVR